MVLRAAGMALPAGSRVGSIKGLNGGAAHLARRWFCFGPILVLLVLVLTGSAWAQASRPLEARATSEIRQTLFPEADRFELAEAGPPHMRVYSGEELVGYLFSTLDVVRARSYSPTPFDAIVGMDLAGNLTGARVIRHHDPYLQGFPQRVDRLEEFLEAHIGHPVDGTVEAPLTPDFVQGTTISARNMRAGIMDAGRVVLRANDPRPPITEPMIDRLGFSFLDWEQLVEIGAVSNRLVTFGEVSAALAEQGVTPAQMEVPLDRGDADARYTELVVGLATPPLIGRNIITASTYSSVVEPAPEDVVMVAVMSGGYYDFIGSQYKSDEYGHRFERIRLVQGDFEMDFVEDDFDHVGTSVQRSGGPIVRHAGVFTIPLESGFDPLAPFDVVLMVHATDAAGVEHTVQFPVTYQLPDETVLMPPVEPLPPWAEAWLASGVDLAILAVALVALTLIFVFQAPLSRNRRLHLWVRTGFLVFTLVWLGWIAGGQLSIVHVVNYLKAPFEGADLGFYLAEPLIVVISIYVVLSLFLIGRGVFCGWLCPFGALQELTSRIARLLRLPVWNPSQATQRWMWLPKYGLAALIVGTAFAVPEALASVEEVEPFKTAITSAFTRPWPYVTYALVLLVMGLFTERFFCRFLCPLGGVLALGDRLHLFTFLKRRPECGTGGCHLCERSCPVKAIEPSGRIVMAECFQCLDCQVEYYDDHRCPPLVWARKGRKRAANPRPRQSLVLTRNGATV
ncbi:4Fe-4S binding protein [Pelagibacterium sp. 26DY04]|uniref:4Fe-4S binding protein n=1 Tax=Pelagibacterium sp. 26DY04 TaxID=2967130 RepID=UPI0028165CAC|nr:4Fe-4S binding protein [Pelagibacterium sp. 26DY04]WMT87138.1 4Fe-4S binding protein [Pelagibacterium sp. 26DY04]